MSLIPVLENDPTRVNGAPLEALQQLSNLIASNAASLSGHDVYLNYGGEVIDRAPSTIASLCKAGAVWIDYCGWPMWYESGGNPGEGGFQDFITSAGEVATASPVSSSGPIFGPPSLYWMDSPESMLAPYSRFLTVDKSISQLNIINGNHWRTNLSAPYGTVGYFNPINPLVNSVLYGYTSFAVHIDKGAYIYASGNSSTWVSPSVYATFIKQIFNGLTTTPTSPTPGTQPPSWWSGLSQTQKDLVVLGGVTVAGLLAGGIYLALGSERR